MSEKVGLDRYVFTAFSHVKKQREMGVVMNGYMYVSLSILSFALGSICTYLTA